MNSRWVTILLLFTAVLPVYAGVSEYDLDVTVEAERLRLAGTWLLPPTDVPRHSIEFLLSPIMGDLRVEIVEPPRAARLELLERGGDNRWRLTPAATIAPGTSPLLRFSAVSSGSAPQFRISSTGSFAGGGGELWYPQISYRDREIGRLTFHVDASHKVIAPGLPERAPPGQFRFAVRAPVKFGFASGPYTVTHEGGTPSFALYTLSATPGRDEIAAGCARIAGYLSRLFGRFPYPRFALVEVDFASRVQGTSEFGFILADKSQFDGPFDVAYWAHEIAHQWWGVLVTARSGTMGQMMLTEGIAQWAALLTVEELLGTQAAEQFRRTGLRATQSAAGYFALLREGKDLPLTGHIPRNADETLLMHRLVNSKGFLVLHMLSRQVGKHRLTAVLREFLAAHRNEQVSWSQLQAAIEAIDGEASSFFRQWLERTGAPALSLWWRQTGRSVHIVIAQCGQPLDLVIDVEATSRSRRAERRVLLTGSRTDLVIPVRFMVNSVTLDPYFHALHRVVQECQ